MGQVDISFLCWDLSTWRNSCQSDPSGLLRVRLQSWKHGRLMAPAAWQCSRIQQGLNFIFLAVCGAGQKRKSCTSASCNAEHELFCFLLWESRPAFLEDTEEIKISLTEQRVWSFLKWNKVRRNATTDADFGLPRQSSGLSASELLGRVHNVCPCLFMEDSGVWNSVMCLIYRHFHECGINKKVTYSSIFKMEEDMDMAQLLSLVLAVQQIFHRPNVVLPHYCLLNV